MPPGFDINPVEVGTPAPQPNALQTIGQLAETQNAINQNKMFPLQYQTGQVGLATARQALQEKQYNAAQQIGASTANADDWRDAMVRATQAGVLSPEFTASAFGGNVQGLDQASLAPIWERNRKQAIMAAGNTQEVTALTGTPTPVSTGGATKFENVNPFTNTVSPMGGPSANIPNELTPPERNTAAYQYWDGSQMRTALQGDVADARAAGKLLPGQTAPGSDIAAQPPPGYEVGANASSLQYQKALADVPTDQGTIAQLKDAHQLLNTPGVQTGPGSDAINHWRDAAIRFLGSNAALIPGLDATTIASANNDELHKDMVRMASALSSESGAPGSDMRLASAITGNANINMTNLPNDVVTAMNAGLLRYRQAGALAFQKSGEPGGDANFTKWLAQNFATKVDPLAFAADMMPAERRKAVIKDMTPTDYKRYMNGVGAATKLGFYQMSDIPGLGQ